MKHLLNTDISVLFLLQDYGFLGEELDPHSPAPSGTGPALSHLPVKAGEELDLSFLPDEVPDDATGRHRVTVKGAWLLE